MFERKGLEAPEMLVQSIFKKEERREGKHAEKT